MTNRCLGLVLAVVWMAAGLCYAAENDPVPDLDGLLKWVQFPDMESGRDYYSHYREGSCLPQYGRADDWECLDGLPVIDIHWWGSYKCNQYGPIDGFAISIYADVPADGGCLSYSHPSELLWQEMFSFADANEMAYGVDGYGNDVYAYTVYVDEPFEQQIEEIYWLSIVALSGDLCGPKWGWHSSDTHNIDSAVVGKLIVPDQEMGPVFKGFTVPFCHDLAFGLTTVPEPGLCLLVILGLLATLWRKTFHR